MKSTLKKTMRMAFTGPMRNMSLLGAVTALGFAFSATQAEGASIAYIGADETTGGSWLDTSVTKSLDATAPGDSEPDNKYGSDGYHLVYLTTYEFPERVGTASATEGNNWYAGSPDYSLNQLPAYVTLARSSNLSTNGNINYDAFSDIDNPVSNTTTLESPQNAANRYYEISATPIGQSTVGSMYANPTASTGTEFVSLTFSEAKSVRLALLANTVDGGSPLGFTVSDGTESAYTGLLTPTNVANSTPRYYFFELTVEADDVITISAHGDGGETRGLSGIFLDESSGFSYDSIPNGDFEVASGADWSEVNDGTSVITYPAGFATIAHTASEAPVKLVANGGAAQTLSSVGLASGATYTFSVDMRLDAGANLGGLLVEFGSGSNSAGSTGILDATLIGDGSTFETYTFDVKVPSAADSMTVSLASGDGSTVSYDNVVFNTEATTDATVTSIGNADFEAAGDNVGWATTTSEGTFVTTFESTGGNPDGYVSVDHSADDGGSLFLYANNGDIASLSDLGLVPQNTYEISIDMLNVDFGLNLGGLIVNFYAGESGNGNTSELFIPFEDIIDDSVWDTYTFNFYVPAGTDGIKFGLVNGEGTTVGFDNIVLNTTAVSTDTNPIADSGLELAAGSWQDGGNDNTTFTYYTDGGVDNTGYAEMSHSGEGFGVLVANNNTIISLADLGMTGGNAYNFTSSMANFGGDNIGGLKFEYFTGTTNIGNSSSEPAFTGTPGDGVWNSYTHTAVIPAAADGIKVILLWGADSTVGYDAVSYDNTPVSTDPIINYDFENGGASWNFVGGGADQSFSATGGNPDGYGILDHTSGSGWGSLWVANGDTKIDISTLDLVADNTYEFVVDMKIEVDENGAPLGDSVGRLKIEYYGADDAGLGNTGDMVTGFVAGDGTTWTQYSFPATLPAGTETIKIVPLNGPNSKVGYDNYAVRTPVSKSIAVSAGANGTITAGAVTTTAVSTGIPNADFESGLDNWGSALSGEATTSAENGYGIIDHSAGGGWGAVLVANGDAPIAIENFDGIAPGNTHDFFMDMKLLSGSSNGGLKLEFKNADGGAISDTGDMKPDLIGDGTTFETYTFNVSIPAGTASIKVVPLWGADSSVAFDNISYNPLAEGAVAFNTNQTYTITPDSGYKITDVIVNGASVGAVTSYEFTSVVNAGQTIAATFELLPTDVTITASVTGGNGTISDTGDTIIGSGNDKTYTATPDAGYQVTHFIVDGTVIDADGNTYTFSSLDQGHTISVRFASTDQVALDFGSDGYGAANGWNDINEVGGTATLSGINGGNTAFTIAPVGKWATGFYTSDAATRSAPFTLSGLIPGQTVALYAAAGWDAGNGAYIVYGDNAPNGVKAENIGSYSGDNDITNLTYIGTATANENGEVSGEMNGRVRNLNDGNPIFTEEGQSNGFVFAINDDAPVATLASWIANYPGVGAATAFDDDPDGDGLSNGYEYAFGTDPSSASSGQGSDLGVISLDAGKAFDGTGIPNNDFSNGLDNWGIALSGSAVATGENGYGVIDDTAGGGWGAVLVANDDAPIPVENLGVEAGSSYKIRMDMKLLAGVNNGGIKLEYKDASGGAVSDTGDMKPALIGDGTTFETYEWDMNVPANTAAIKIVPLWGSLSSVAVDNVVIGAPATASIDFTLPNEDISSSADVVYKWSTDLENWYGHGETANGVTVTFTKAADTPSAGTSTVTATASGTSLGKVFIKVDVVSGD
jgi:hypothetical protein